MNRISAEELAAELNQVLDAVLAGEEILITREGTPVAKIVRARSPIRGGFGGAADYVHVREDFHEPLPDLENYMPPEE